jgi:hypothetical protein
MTALRAEPGRIVGRGGFRTASGRWVRRGVRFAFAPSRCGARLTWRARPGDRYRYLAFFRTDWGRPSRTVSDGTYAVTFSAKPAVGGGDLFTSATEIRLVRASASFRAKRGGTAAVEVCAD